MRFPQEVKEFIHANAWGKSTKELTDLINEKFGTKYDEMKIRYFKRNNKIKSGISAGSALKGKPSKVFPKQIFDYIIQNHKGTSIKDMANKLNEIFGTGYTEAQIKAFYGNHKLKNGNDTKFKKGDTPVNKGKKGVCHPACKKTWFKKGNIPTNLRTIGEERINVDGYIEVKVEEPNIWRQKHRVVWEENNGPIEEGMIIGFLDGDKTNIELENLILMTRAEHLEITRNGYRSNDPEITETGLAVVKLNQARKKRIEEKRKHE